MKEAELPTLFKILRSDKVRPILTEYCELYDRYYSGSPAVKDELDAPIYEGYQRFNFALKTNPLMKQANDEFIEFLGREAVGKVPYNDVGTVTIPIFTEFGCKNPNSASVITEELIESDNRYTTGRTKNKKFAIHTFHQK